MHAYIGISCILVYEYYAVYNVSHAGSILGESQQGFASSSYLHIKNPYDTRFVHFLRNPSIKLLFLYLFPR